MTRLTDHEADPVRQNPGLFDKATEDEAWDMHYARLRAAAGHGPETCCNHDCRQGRDCPLRRQRQKPIPRTALGIFLLAYLALLIYAAPDFSAWMQGADPVFIGDSAP